MASSMQPLEDVRLNKKNARKKGIESVSNVEILSRPFNQVRLILAR